MRLSVVFLILTIVVCAMFQESVSLNSNIPFIDKFPKNNDVLCSVRRNPSFLKQRNVRNVVVNPDAIKQLPPPLPPPPLQQQLMEQVEEDATSWTQFHLKIQSQMEATKIKY